MTLVVREIKKVSYFQNGKISNIVISKRKWLAYYRYLSYMNYVSPILVNRTSFDIITANQLAEIKCLEIQKQ